MFKEFKTIDGETLMNTSFEPIKYVVEDLIPQGLHILSGSPKIGKSWLVLWLCLQIAKGESVWNFNTDKGTSLYLCLEDSITRIQNRLFDITEDAPPNIYFSTVAENIGTGIEEQINNFVLNHPDTKLIVIDTFQKIRTPTNDNAYSSDYRDICFLKSIADRLKISILLIHHLRKQIDNDPMNMVSGTTGITGAVDSSFVLQKSKRSGDRATLYCTGRDIEYRELELYFNSETKIWDLISDSIEKPEMLLENIIVQVIEFLQAEHSFYGTPSEFAERLQPYCQEKIVPNVLSKRLLQNKMELEELGIKYCSKRSNGKRLIDIHMSDDSDDKSYIQTAVPAGTE